MSRVDTRLTASGGEPKGALLSIDDSSSASDEPRLKGNLYANAIPLELLKRDQDRITEQEDKAKTELAETEADLSKWQELLTGAIRLAGSCHAAYLKANPKVRHRFNGAVLKAVYIEDGKIKRAEFTDVFAALFSRPSSNKVGQGAPGRNRTKGVRHGGVACRVPHLVGGRLP